MGILGHMKNNSLVELCAHTFGMSGCFEFPLDLEQVPLSLSSYLCALDDGRPSV